MAIGFLPISKKKRCAEGEVYGLGIPGSKQRQRGGGPLCQEKRQRWPALSGETAAVARFVGRNGSGIYMASVETDEIPLLRERVTSTGGGWQGTDFGGFIHPGRLHGLLPGLVTYETWNGRRPLPDWTNKR